MHAAGPDSRGARKRSVTPRALRIVARVFLAAGLLALAHAAYVVIDAQVYQTIEHRRFETVRPESLAMQRATDGEAIGTIQIPRLGLTAVVAEGDSPSVLRRAVGHVADTALPGERGNVVLAGHRDTFFRPLKRVRIGDVITLTTHHGDVEYLVESTTVVGPSDVQVLEATDHNALTLITCFPFSFIGAAPDRFIVRGREAKTPR